MTDYGHELILGTFITPQNQRPQDVVGLAQLTERAGLDLVTFMDHPYHSGFLDTWTLMSYVAARTERVHLSGYVLNLPSRHPAYLAKATASLDLLSGGRVELGLGPGDYHVAHEIEAMGGPRRTRAQSVRALSEAIDIIRGIWDPAEAGRLQHAGKQYQIPGAIRGPRPAHDISIWVPAEGPVTRRLVGRKADGWITGAAWMSDVPSQLAEGNRIVDDAAAEAGRDPSQIRRIFDFHGSFADHRQGQIHGDPEQWVQQLLPLVTEYGIGTFILIGNDPLAIERWGSEVAPALRVAVARERQRSDLAELSS
jgi:alkanesulfonate monooxygenase SsuD/methylene tetrahydromethanopterin reductase-like flavin-dependent oxidoreductase (luciferase family)